MPKIFINYRTNDGQSDALALDQDLCQRFGKENVFYASRSIPAGEDFTYALTAASRRCRVLLAVIGPDWLAAWEDANTDTDWILREIMNAKDSGAIIIPIIVGRLTELLPKDGDPDNDELRRLLPKKLDFLSKRQYRRFDHRDSRSFFDRLARDLVELIPELAVTTSEGRADTSATPNAPQPGNTSQSGGIGSVSGIEAGSTVIGTSNSPVNSGSGTQYNAPTFGGSQYNGNASGTTITGDAPGSVTHTVHTASSGEGGDR